MTSSIIARTEQGPWLGWLCCCQKALFVVNAGAGDITCIYEDLTQLVFRKEICRQRKNKSSVVHRKRKCSRQNSTATTVDSVGSWKVCKWGISHTRPPLWTSLSRPAQPPLIARTYSTKSPCESYSTALQKSRPLCLSYMCDHLQ